MGRRGTFRRRDAQLSSMDLLSQLQTFLIGHVLLLPRMALVPQEKVARPHQNRAQNLGGSSSTPEIREVALPSLSGFEFCCHLCMPEHHEYSRPSTLSTLLTLPSPNSLPASLQPLLSSCAPLSPHSPLSPHALLSPHPPHPPAPSLPWQPIPPLPTPPCSHISGLPILPPSPFLLPCLDLHTSRSRKPTGIARKLESHFPITPFPAHPAFTSSEEHQVM